MKAIAWIGLFATVLLAGCAIAPRASAGGQPLAHTLATPRAEVTEAEAAKLAARVKAETLHAWQGYKQYAWGHDALKPLSKTPHDWYPQSLLMTPVDALDTLMLMGLDTQADEARELIATQLSFDHDMYVQNFEVTIRLLGGLLSGYQLSGDERLLVLAEDLGKRLLPVFESETGLPYTHVNLRTGQVRGKVSNPAETGTLLLEFGMLSKLTGDPVYYDKAKRALVATWERRSKIGLVGAGINVETGEWTDPDSHIGGGIDSYYEYLYKCWRLFGDADCKRMWDSSIVAVNTHLADEVRDNELWYGHADMDSGERTATRYGALDAFMPALLAVAGDLPRARRLQDSGMKMWRLHDIEPESLDYQSMQVTSPGYALRPEIVESAYYLHRLTGDPKYRAMGREMFEDLIRHCRTPEAYAALKDVRSKEQADSMESFLFAETFKYYYLLFAPAEAMDFEAVTLNTEAHPLRWEQHPEALIPQPRELQRQGGAFVLDGSVGIVAPDDPRSREIAAFAREAIARDNDVELSEHPQDRVIELRIDPAVDGEEAYRLTATPSRVQLVASNHRGLFWAVQTLRQLIHRDGGTASIPAVYIEDAPVFSYRGHMLDVGRHFMPVEFIKKQIDLLSYYKINTFRWHLTDDQGWRIEIRKYPKLTEVGAWRTEPDGSRYGGFYTREQVREVVEYARLRNIMVIPEIEMPGHASAALAAYPELSCRDEPIEVPNSWGVFKDVYCVGEPATLAFIKDVLDEVIALFPAPYVHIGGDEAPKDRWQQSAASQQLMREQGLKDEHELQSWFIHRVQNHLASKGKTLIGWDEILEGGLDNSAVVEVWRGPEQGAKALANGNRIIVAGPFYLDSPGESLTLGNLYRTAILAPPAYAAHHELVLGAEAPLWTEHVTPTNAEAMLYPRLLAFAEVTWAAPEPPRDYADFKQRLQMHYKRLEDWQVAYGPEARNLVGYQLAWNPPSHDWTLHAQRGFDDMRVHYTLDGSEPDIESSRFTDALTITKPGTIRVAPFRSGRQAMVSRRFDIVGHRALGAPVTYSVPADPRYWQGGPTALVDGLFGGDNFDDGLWAGWQGENLVATIDLQRSIPVHSISARFLQQSGSWILLPKAVRYSVSTDGERWTQVHAQTFDADAGNVRRFVEEAVFTADRPIAARHVRIEVERYGPLPQGHGGAGRPAYFFVDEIVVR